jgi:1,2-diacylglycerol 3-alpha-glucosyltransferase
MQLKSTIAVVFHHIGPYHHARLNAASEKFSVIGFEWSAKEQDAWGAAASPARYHKVALFPEAAGEFPRNAHLRRAFYSALEKTNPVVVAVNGWNDFGSLAAASCCLRCGIPLVVMSESAGRDEHRTWWKEIVKQGIVELYSAALVGGQRHLEYLIELGMPHGRIFTGYDVVDNEHFARNAIAIRDSRFAIRKKYGLPENYFLASARFIQKKNLLMLIEAYAEYRQRSEVRGQESIVSARHTPWELVLLGDGPLKADLCSLICDLQLNGCVHMPGFKRYDELPVYYALAKAFVHASTTEQWGLVVNEAIASGLPVIVSKRCGCVPELVQHNGFTFDPMNREDLASRLLKMASLSDDERQSLGDASRGIAANFGPERFGEGLEQAAHLALTSLPKRSIFNRIMIDIVAFGATTADRKKRCG